MDAIDQMVATRRNACAKNWVQTRNLYRDQSHEWKNQWIVQECLNLSTEIVSVMKTRCRKKKLWLPQLIKFLQSIQKLWVPTSNEHLQVCITDSSQESRIQVSVLHGSSIEINLFVYTALLFFISAFSPHIVGALSYAAQQFWSSSFYWAQCKLCNWYGIAASIWSGELDFPWKLPSPIDIGTKCKLLIIVTLYLQGHADAMCLTGSHPQAWGCCHYHKTGYISKSRFFLVSFGSVWPHLSCFQTVANKN